MKRTTLALLAASALPGALVLLVSLVQFVLGFPHVATAYAAVLVSGITLPCVCALGLPGHLLLQRLGWRRLHHYVAGGLWAGVAVSSIIVLPFDLAFDRIIWLVPACVTAAIGCAALFWWIAVREPLG